LSDDDDDNSDDDNNDDSSNRWHFEAMHSSSNFEAQVALIFGKGLGPADNRDVLRRDEVAPPQITSAAISAPTPTFEPMSAVVEWWEPADNRTMTRDAAMDSKSQGRSNDLQPATPPLIQEPITYVTAPVPAANVMVAPGPITPNQPLSPSPADYEFVASLGQDAFSALSLAVHKQSRRQCLVKAVSNAVVEEETVVRALLEEQRIMREVSGHPFLLGLMASFHDANGFYLITVRPLLFPFK
jgi:hypothetical protein